MSGRASERDLHGRSHSSESRAEAVGRGGGGGSRMDAWTDDGDNDGVFNTFCTAVLFSEDPLF